MIVSTFLLKGIKLYQDKPIHSGFYISVGIIFWIADFYGVWRTNNSLN